MSLVDLELLLVLVQGALNLFFASVVQGPCVSSVA